MDSQFGLLLCGAYLLGSVPSAYLVGKWARGIDIRQYGSGNVGVSNLMRFTSKRAAIPVVIFDLVKGGIMMLVAWRLGLSVTQQIFVGMVAVIGHNWPVFLRFNGGRGILTATGVGFFLPILNNLTPFVIHFLVTIGYGAIALVSIYLKRFSLGIFIIFAAIPIVTWGMSGSLPLTLGYLCMFLIIVVRRLTASKPISNTHISKKQSLLNRLLYDRDIKDKATWMFILDRQQKKQTTVVDEKNKIC
jgi:glycerol-3-phosphate acyltransferase PlsY